MSLQVEILCYYAHLVFFLFGNIYIYTHICIQFERENLFYSPTHCHFSHRDGYKGNGYFCQFEEVDKCDTPCATNGICTLNRTTNTYGCACLPGSRGDGITCIPITAQLSELEDSTKLGQ